MARKKILNVNADPVYSRIKDSTAEPAPQKIPPRSPDEPPTNEEIMIARETYQTQGRKGVQAIRINMAFSPAVHEYIKRMSRVMGLSITEFTEMVFKKSMEDNAELYDKAKQFEEELK